MLRRVPGQGLLRVRRDQSGDPLCILRLFIVVIFTLMQKMDKSDPGILAKTKPSTGCRSPLGTWWWPHAQGKRGNKDEGLKVKPEHFGQNEAKNL
jgi:hypothetical protein